MKRFIIIPLMLVACANGITSVDLSFTEDKNPPDTQVPSEGFIPPSHDASINSSVDAPTDTDASVCESGEIVGHCLTNMRTLCFALPANHEKECLETGLVTGWFPGSCGENDNGLSDLSRSNGGCKDMCGIIRWYYPLSGGNPTIESKQSTQKNCEDLNMIFIPAPEDGGSNGY